MMLHLLKVVLAFYGLALTYHTEKFLVILTALGYKLQPIFPLSFPRFFACSKSNTLGHFVGISNMWQVLGEFEVEAW